MAVIWGIIWGVWALTCPHLGLRYWSSGTIGGPFMLFLFSDHNVGLSLILVLNLFLISFLILVSYDAYRMWYVVRSMTHTGCGMSCGPTTIYVVLHFYRPFMSCSIHNDHLCRATIYVVICALKIYWASFPRAFISSCLISPCQVTRYLPTHLLIQCPKIGLK